MLCEDFAFYVWHRIAHLPYMYNLHKVHHENKVVFCLAAIHSHPIDYIFGSIFPLMAGSIVLRHRLHRASLFGWYFVRVCETIDAHCGYDFPFLPFRLMPFQLTGDYHYFHHTANVGNYATFFSWWDTIFGTNREYYRHH